jgi:hypothetical protein
MLLAGVIEGAARGVAVHPVVAVAPCVPVFGLGSGMSYGWLLSQGGRDVSLYLHEAVCAPDFRSPAKIISTTSLSPRPLFRYGRGRPCPFLPTGAGRQEGLPHLGGLLLQPHPPRRVAFFPAKAYSDSRGCRKVQPLKEPRHA